MERNKGKLYTAVTGMIMGLAEVVPGVSGGTIAFVAGIYEKLLTTIDELRIGVLALPKKGLKPLISRLDWSFLIALFTGMIIGIIAGVFSITYLLEHYPPIIWAFFFGLIIASSIYMLGKVRLNGQTWVMVLLGAIVAFVLGSLGYSTGSEAWWFILICGMIAITALVLPGISGSFMLLMLGMYTFIIRDTVKGIMTDFSMDKVINLGIFGVGCILGLFSIARLLKWALDRYHDATVAILTGFMVGSLQKIWPWREPTLVLEKETGELLTSLPDTEFKIISEALVWPWHYGNESYLILSALACLLGMLLIWAFARLEGHQKPE